MRSFITAVALAAAATTVTAQNTTARNDTAACAALAAAASQRLGNLTVILSAFQPAGLVINDTAQGGYQTALGGPYNAMCRFRGIITTSPQSSVLFEVFMPETSAWNRDFMLVGNGGVNGFISYPTMAVPLNTYGYAVASTNTGHNGTSGNGSFALNNPESQIDFGYRAVHLTTVYSKAIVQLFYGQAHNTSYYSGCSSGGKQGVKELEMYPEDFDAAIVGSMAQPWSRLNGWTQYVNAIVNPPTSTGYINTTAWGSIHNEVLAQCDALDGVTDGILLEPGKCVLNYTRFQCGSNSTLNATTCLQPAQVQTLQKIYRNWTDPSTGEQLFPAFNIGAEFLFAQSVNGVPYGPAPNYFLYQVLNVTQAVLPYDTPALTINGSAVNETQLINLVRIGDRTNPGGADASNPNISAYFNRGGKLIMYVGGADWLIPTNTTANYFANVRNTLGNVSNNMVYYEIPGMGHCSGGVAAWNLGLPSQTLTAGQSLNSTSITDATLALRAWKVNGTRPGVLVGANYNNNNKSAGVAFTRKICPWPLVGRYNGSGNTTDAASYDCRA